MLRSIRSRNMLSLCAASALALALGACATTKDQDSSDTASRPEQEQPGMATPSQERFSATEMNSSLALNQLHHINQKEIQLAQLAQKKAQSPQIKQAAQQILTDHQEMAQKVEAAAKQQNVKLQAFQPSTHEKASMDRLESLEGTQFDQAFAWVESQAHQQAIQQLQLTRRQVRDAQLQSLIDSMLPRMSSHAALSRQMNQAAGQAVMGTDDSMSDSSSDMSMEPDDSSMDSSDSSAGIAGDSSSEYAQ